MRARIIIRDRAQSYAAAYYILQTRFGMGGLSGHLEGDLLDLRLFLDGYPYDDWYRRPASKRCDAADRGRRARLRPRYDRIFRRNPQDLLPSLSMKG